MSFVEREDRHSPWVDRGGYNVPRHLVGLIDEDGIHPDEVCAISDLFSSEDEFRGALIGFANGSEDPRVKEMVARAAKRIEEAREESRQSREIVDWANGLANRLPEDVRSSVFTEMASHLPE